MVAMFAGQSVEERSLALHRRTGSRNKFNFQFITIFVQQVRGKMKDFIEQQWNEYAERLKSSAQEYAGDDESLKTRFVSEAESFVAAEEVGDYGSLLDRMAAGQAMVLRWRADSPTIDESVANNTAGKVSD